MPLHIPKPSVIEAAGTKPKVIREHVGRVNSLTENVSVAHMTSPSGWSEPGQRPESGEWIRYSTPSPEGADYVAVCVPAFSPSTAHRDG